VDSSVLIANERWKAWSTNLTRLGSGLLAYVGADVYVRQELTAELIVPLIFGLFLGWLGHKFLGLLQSEKTA
jgi:hypothetical protein